MTASHSYACALSPPPGETVHDYNEHRERSELQEMEREVDAAPLSLRDLRSDVMPSPVPRRYVRHTPVRPASTHKSHAPPSNEAAHALASLLSTGEDSDVVFLINGSGIYAHSHVLIARSDYFKALLAEAWIREPAVAGQRTRIPLEGVSFGVFSALLRFVYLGFVEPPPDQELDLLIAARRFRLPQLVRACERAVVSVLHPLRAGDTLQEALELGSTRVVRGCVRTIAGNLAVCLADPAVRALPAEVLLAVLDEVAVVNARVVRDEPETVDVAEANEVTPSSPRPETQRRPPRRSPETNLPQLETAEREPRDTKALRSPPFLPPISPPVTPIAHTRSQRRNGVFDIDDDPPLEPLPDLFAADEATPAPMASSVFSHPRAAAASPAVHHDRPETARASAEAEVPAPAHQPVQGNGSEGKGGGSAAPAAGLRGKRKRPTHHTTRTAATDPSEESECSLDHLSLDSTPRSEMSGRSGRSRTSNATDGVEEARSLIAELTDIIHGTRDAHVRGLDEDLQRADEGLDQSAAAAHDHGWVTPSSDATPRLMESPALSRSERELRRSALLSGVFLRSEDARSETPADAIADSTLPPDDARVVVVDVAEDTAAGEQPSVGRSTERFVASAATRKHNVPAASSEAEAAAAVINTLAAKLDAQGITPDTDKAREPDTTNAAPLATERKARPPGGARLPSVLVAAMAKRQPAPTVSPKARDERMPAHVDRQTDSTRQRKSPVPGRTPARRSSGGKGAVASTSQSRLRASPGANARGRGGSAWRPSGVAQRERGSPDQQSLRPSSAPTRGRGGGERGRGASPRAEQRPNSAQRPRRRAGRNEELRSRIRAVLHVLDPGRRGVLSLPATIRLLELCGSSREQAEAEGTRAEREGPVFISEWENIVEDIVNIKGPDVLKSLELKLGVAT